MKIFVGNFCEHYEILCEIMKSLCDLIGSGFYVAVFYEDNNTHSECNPCRLG